MISGARSSEALDPGEEILWGGKSSLLFYLRWWRATWILLPMLWHTSSGLPVFYRLLGMPFYILALLLPFPWLVYLLLKWSRTRYCVTNKRVLAFSGRVAESLPLHQPIHIE